MVIYNRRVHNNPATIARNNPTWASKQTRFVRLLILLGFGTVVA